MALRIEPTGAPLGAFVHGLDMENLTEANAVRLYQGDRLEQRLLTESRVGDVSYAVAGRKADVEDHARDVVADQRGHVRALLEKCRANLRRVIRAANGRCSRRFKNFRRRTPSRGSPHAV